MDLRQKLIRRWKIFGYNFTFVLRHRWEIETEVMGNYSNWIGGYQLGFWFKRHQVVGSKGFKDPKNWSKNHVNEYMLGFHGIVFKCWITVQKGAMVLGLD